MVGRKRSVSYLSLAFGFLRCFFKLIALRAPCLWVGGDMGETTLIVFITIKVIALSYQFGFYFCLIVLPIESTLNYTGDRHSPTHNHFHVTARRHPGQRVYGLSVDIVNGHLGISGTPIRTIQSRIYLRRCRIGSQLLIIAHAFHSLVIRLTQRLQ